MAEFGGTLDIGVNALGGTAEAVGSEGCSWEKKGKEELGFHDEVMGKNSGVG